MDNIIYKTIVVIIIIIIIAWSWNIINCSIIGETASWKDNFDQVEISNKIKIFIYES